jgi:thioredoxin-related protein
MDPKQAGNEEVLIHIYSNYIEGKDLHWMKEDRKRGLHSRVMAAIRTGKGEKISGINLPGTDHKIIQLDSIQSKYLLLVIWDVSCEHCRELLPALDQVYNKSLKNKGVSMLAISFESTAGKKDWLEYIKANKLMNWKHMHYSVDADKKRKESGKEGLSKTLSVRSFPLIYLLNDKKIILAKNPSLDSLPDRVE